MSFAVSARAKARRDGNIEMDWLLLAPIAGLASFFTAVLLFLRMRGYEGGMERMQEIAAAIREGAEAYMRRPNKTLAIFVLLMATILALSLGYNVALSYALGSLCTTLASYFGMSAAVRANVRTTNGARNG